MWLLCAFHETSIGGVTSTYKSSYDKLIDELIELEKLNEGCKDVIERYNRIEGMENVVPKKELAVEEFEYRNGYFIDLDGGRDNFHRELLRGIGIDV